MGAPKVTIKRHHKDKSLWCLFIVTLGATAMIGTALAFEHLGGYVPCALCLQQRIPYYVGIPFMCAACVVGYFWRIKTIVRIGLAIAFLALGATAVLGAYHAGVEWGWFEGPAGCGAGLSAQNSDASTLFDSLSTAKPPSCGEAAGRFLGVSFAGWNVIGAGFFAFLALKGLLYNHQN